MLIGTISLGNAAPNMHDFAVARGAAYTLFAIIDRVSNCKKSNFKLIFYVMLGNIPHLIVTLSWQSKSIHTHTNPN